MRLPGWPPSRIGSQSGRFYRHLGIQSSALQRTRRLQASGSSSGPSAGSSEALVSSHVTLLLRGQTSTTTKINYQKIIWVTTIDFQKMIVSTSQRIIFTLLSSRTQLISFLRQSLFEEMASSKLKKFPNQSQSKRIELPKRATIKLQLIAWQPLLRDSKPQHTTKRSISERSPGILQCFLLLVWNYDVGGCQRMLINLPVRPRKSGL